MYEIKVEFRHFHSNWSMVKQFYIAVHLKYLRDVMIEIVFVQTVKMILKFAR